MTLSDLLTLASILALTGIGLETVERYENAATSASEVLVLSALRTLATFQVYACGSWMVTMALGWIVLNIRG